jgi:RNA polymerase sigma-70 factor, ECF subfamily
MDPRKLSARELVQLCLGSRDEAMWEEFVRRFQPLIAGVIAKRLFRHTGYSFNHSLVDDLTQETFVKICINDFKALREFEYQHENALFGFVKVIATHVVEDHFRNSSSQKRWSGHEEEDVEELEEALPAASDLSEPMGRSILIGEIKRCLQKHAEDPNFVRDYAIFWLYYKYGFTAKTISKLPGIELSVKGVESRLLRLTRLLRGKLAVGQG